MILNFALCSVRLRVAKLMKRAILYLLVRFSKPIGWAFYGIAEDLEKALGRKVDLATENMIGKRIRESVMRDLQVIYEKTEQRRPFPAYSWGGWKNRKVFARLR